MIYLFSYLSYFNVYQGEYNKIFSYLPYKARLARNKTLDYLGTKSYAKFCLTTELLTGKGMASSSADIASICQLTALSCKRILSQDEISKIATSIEPTDGIFVKALSDIII